jgi:quercetin dioxygenase-like cupin family protein
MEFPFSQENIDGKLLRTFSSNVDEEELKWHYDLCDREVLVLEGQDWELQIDNELPKKLKPSEKYFIPKGVYHRVIKGTGDLVVLIEEF